MLHAPPGLAVSVLVARVEETAFARIALGTDGVGNNFRGDFEDELIGRGHHFNQFGRHDVYNQVACN